MIFFLRRQFPSNMMKPTAFSCPSSRSPFLHVSLGNNSFNRLPMRQHQALPRVRCLSSSCVSASPPFPLGLWVPSSSYGAAPFKENMFEDIDHPPTTIGMFPPSLSVITTAGICYRGYSLGAFVIPSLKSTLSGEADTLMTETFSAFLSNQERQTSTPVMSPSSLFGYFSCFITRLRHHNSFLVSGK